MTVVNKAAPALCKLLEDSALSRAVFSACRVPLALIDATRRITLVNPAFEQFFGWQESECLGRALATLVMHGDDGRVQRLVADPGLPWTMQTWRKDGELRQVEVTLGAIRRVDGRLTHFVISFSDRTEVEQLRAELQAALEPARGAEQPRVEVPPPHQLHA